MLEHGAEFLHYCGLFIFMCCWYIYCFIPAFHVLPHPCCSWYCFLDLICIHFIVQMWWKNRSIEYWLVQVIGVGLWLSSVVNYWSVILIWPLESSVWYWKHWYQCVKRVSSWNCVPEPYNRKVECSTLFASSSLCPNILGKVVCIMFSCSPITLVYFLCLY